MLAERGLRPKKRLGQNFLTDRGIAQKIARLCIQGHDMVVEIGPGTGTLTRELVALGANVNAIEIDAGLVGLLRDDARLGGANIIEADALTFDFDTLTRGASWCAAGNLPYNVATPLVMRWLELRDAPRRIVAMVQRDVADRFAAQPGTPAYGSLSVAVQFAATVKREFVVGPRSFYPAPKVQSAVVVMERREHPPVEVNERSAFLKVVRAAFAYRRKTLANSLWLALDIPRERTAETLQRLGRPMEIRAEQLGLADFAALSNQLAT